MIAYLRGTVLNKTPRALIVSVGTNEKAGGAIGYQVFVTGQTLDTATLEKEIALWTHHAVREDSSDLYGFPDEETLSFFELLISVSGIGPRSALNILNIVTPKTLRQAVSSGDTSYLTKVSGIGRKIADKIVIELKDKFEAMNEADSAATGAHLRGESDALEALRSLGYGERESRDVLKKISAEKGGDVLTAGDKVKRALKILGQG